MRNSLRRSDYNRYVHYFKKKNKLPSFTEFYRVLLSFAQSLGSVPFFCILPGFTVFFFTDSFEFVSILSIYPVLRNIWFSYCKLFSSFARILCTLPGFTELAPYFFWHSIEWDRPRASFWNNSPSCTEFFFQNISAVCTVSLGYRGLYRVLPGFTGFCWASPSILDRIRPNSSHYFRVLQFFSING